MAPQGRPLSVRQLALASLCSLFTTAVAADDNIDININSQSILNSEIARQNNQSLLWGPYRPNLYFGVRPRIPESLMTGLMWGKIETYNDFQSSWFHLLVGVFVVICG